MLPSNALSLDLNSATSICSSETPPGLTSAAIFDSVSPRCTVYLSPAAALGSARSRGAAGAAAGAAAAGAAAAAAGAAAGRVVALPWRTGVTGSTTGAGAPAPGGSSRNVYSRTTRPAAQLASSIRSR